MKKILLTQGFSTLVDDVDFERLSKFKWHAHKKGRRIYASRASPRDEYGKQVVIAMHAFLLGLIPGDGRKGDHIDGNGLNNQRLNLRVATTAQNSRSFQRKRIGTTSRFRGVYWDASRLRWRSKVESNGKTIHIGQFESEEAAARAYDTTARRVFGDFAYSNFPL